MAAMVLGGLIPVTILGFFSGKFDDQLPEIQEPAALKLDGSQTLPKVYEKHLPFPTALRRKPLVTVSSPSICFHFRSLECSFSSQWWG